MSDQELYEIAHRRINRRNRRWTFWAVDMAGLILTVAALILLSDTPYVTIAVAVMMAWAAVFVFHTIVISMGESREEDIEKEIVKLRAVADAAYEKPKRMELTEDGEIAEYDWQYDEEQGEKQKMG